jgi:hypothetical protein
LVELGPCLPLQGAEGNFFQKTPPDIPDFEFDKVFTLIISLENLTTPGTLRPSRRARNTTLT